MNKLKKKSDRKLRSIQAFTDCTNYCNGECASTADTSGYAKASANSFASAKLNKQ